MKNTEGTPENVTIMAHDTSTTHDIVVILVTFLYRGKVVINRDGKGLTHGKSSRAGCGARRRVTRASARIARKRRTRNAKRDAPAHKGVVGYNSVRELRRHVFESSAAPRSTFRLRTCFAS